MKARLYTNQLVVESQRRRMGALSSDELWARERVSTFPTSWVGRLLGRWRGRHGANAYAANIDHLHRCEAIAKAQKAGVPGDANDDQICQEASESARDMGRRLTSVEAQMVLGQRQRMHRVLEVTAMWWELMPAAQNTAQERAPEQRERLLMLGQFAEALGWLEARGLAEDFLKSCMRSIPATLRRIVCARWWRRVLRKMHARAVEATARAIGLVHKRAGCYVSEDSVKRRRGQIARNARALESVKAINEHGQDFTLAELAAKGPANREIRRHELMTRIAGFELIAKQCGHEALFVTVTCPSRMHAYRTTKKGGYGVEENPKHDGTTPDIAQQYLARQWGRFLSACARWGVQPYGFRIAEPNHDGTPHWHALLFLPKVVGLGTVRSNARAGRPVADRVALRLLRRYFLRNADASERGAKQHRVVVERIDWKRGSAAGYVAKYVAKNIDGYKVEKDLYGNDAITSSQRVDAWASTWRIRQFQQVGGAPVTIWRELRRLNPEQGEAAPAVLMALDAVNVSKSEQGASDAVERYTAATGWAAYTELQGGVRVPRKSLRVKMLRESTGEIGRYGELMAPRAVGVVTDDVRRITRPALGIVPELTTTRTTRCEVESERSTWTMVEAHAKDAQGRYPAVEAMRQRMQRGAPAQREAMRPWSPVNNSTRPAIFESHPVALFGHAVERTRKRGRFFNWNGGVRTKESYDPDRKDPAPSPN